MKKLSVLAAAVIFSLALVVLVPLVALESVAFSPSFYHSQFERLDRPEETGFSEAELMQASQALWEYFRGQRETPQLKLKRNDKETMLYGQRELDHLVDVKKLFQQGMAARTTALLLVILAGAYLLLHRQSGLRLAAKGTLGAAGLVLLLISLTLVLLSIDFNRWFTLFHLISFSNDLWQLDPSRENLIRIFPEPFFFAAARTALIRTAITFLALLTGSLILLSRLPPSQNN